MLSKLIGGINMNELTRIYKNDIDYLDSVPGKNRLEKIHWIIDFHRANWNIDQPIAKSKPKRDISVKPPHKTKPIANIPKPSKTKVNKTKSKPKPKPIQKEVIIEKENILDDDVNYEEFTDKQQRDLRREAILAKKYM